MIRKLVRQMLTAQILSALTVSVCLLIDNIMIARFLGEEGIAAYGLANPVLILIGALGTMLSSGVQVACSRSLGIGSQEETNAGYSSAIGVAAVVSGVFMLVVLLFSGPLATVMGAGREGSLFDSTKGYLNGFILGAPGSMGALILVPFMQMAGKSGLLIAAVLGMTVSDIAFDLLNVLVFDGGMFGMGLASSLSYYVALIIGIFYFLSPRCVFRFSRRQISRAKIRELFKGGVPSLVNMIASVILVFAMNHLLMSSGGESAVAAFTVVTAIGNAACCISTGTSGVSLTLAGILFNEEDRQGLKDLVFYMLRLAVVLGVVMCLILLILAPNLVSVFIADALPSKPIAIRGVRLFAPGMIFCCLTGAMKGTYQGCGKAGTTEAISMLQNALLPVLAAVICGALFGSEGTWLYFVIGEAATLILLIAYTWLKTGRNPAVSDSLLLLPPDFGVSEEDLLEVSIRSMDEVIRASEAAAVFCREHGQPKKTSNHVALCVEEMAGNVVRHGFEAGKDKSLSIRIQHKNKRWVLRFRDDCASFDPVHYVPLSEDLSSGIGIRLVMKMADEVRYTYSMNLNNLTVIFREQA